MPRALLVSKPLLVLVVAATTACAAAFYEPAGFDTVDESYVVGGGTWNTGGGITAVADLQKQDGSTLVCGAWATDQQSTLSYPYNADVMATGSVYLGGTRLVQDLGFMQEADHPSVLAGAEARCVDTGLAWHPDFAATLPEIVFPRYSLSADDEDGDTVTFRQTPRANPFD